MSVKKQVLLILADGFEEIEAVTPIDVLRRAELDVVVAGLGKKVVTGAHGIKFEADMELKAYAGSPDAVVLPGGMPGAANLAASPLVADWLQRVFKANKIIAAICASPGVVLSPLGILNNKQATCYPGYEDRFGATTRGTKDRLVRDGNVITSRGPGTAFEFSLAIVSELAGKSVAERLADGMIFKGIRS